ncbi:MAG TPA: bifunctional metallophosphatase/5'-nucleotidase [Candidatus Aminicenantes bacterium]|nr:bifunctional metallophosphatase/5'-nucleotidase [Candidatus Aminicenantes bacterium]HRY64498.1 bifunctional metallophosphatase/5'-nucleotidase [Candidatus Aminicenantes bacterium]HRZ71411.1 bifunctional metallophosphatase/5'-nucleotidase [Candidatus Aminicenantes bacterium]
MSIGGGKRRRVRGLARLIPVAFAVVAAFLAAAPKAPAQPLQITLLHVNDTHSHLEPWGPKDPSLNGTLGGLAKAATLVTEAKALDPNAIFVLAGDFTEGDLFFNEYLGVPELQMLQSLGLDALVLGNHDLRFGPGSLATVLQNAWPGGGVPILGTNLEIPADNPLLPWVSSTLVKEVNGVKVGLFGLTVPDGAMANPAPVVILSDLPAVAQAAVETLRGGGARVVICVSHFGMDAARGLAGSVPGIDVIVNGHDNAVLKQPEPVLRPDGGTTLIVSAGNFYRWVGRLRLSVSGGQVGLAGYDLLSADAMTPPAPAFQAPIESLKAGIAAIYGDVYHQALAWTQHEIGMDWNLRCARRDTPLGDLFTDAYRAWTDTDIAIEPFAYMGDPLPKGWIVGADVFRAMSYGNLKTRPSGQPYIRPWRLVTFLAAGSEILGALEKTIYMGGDYFPQVSGMRFCYDSTAPPLHRILPDTVHVGRSRIVTDQLYSVTVTEQIYLALVYVLGMTVQDVRTLPDFAFSAACSYIAQRGKLAGWGSNRILDVAEIPLVKKPGPRKRR